MGGGGVGELRKYLPVEDSPKISASYKEFAAVVSLFEAPSPLMYKLISWRKQELVEI
jgi:hypothetical protein